MVAIHQVCFLLIFLQITTITHGLPSKVLGMKEFSKRAFVWHNNCPPEYYYLVENTYATAIKIASKAADKLSDFQRFLGFLNERQDADPYERVILETFEAIYGKVLWDPTEPNYKANNDAGYERVTHILEMTQKIVSLPRDATLNSQLAVMCDERFWSYQVTIGDQPYYRDTRPQQSGGGRLMKLTNGNACDNSNAAGYSWSSTTHRFDNIVLCPKPLAVWVSMSDFSIETFGKITLGPRNWGTMSLDGMMGIWGEGTMLHELSHGHYIFSGTNLVSADIECPSKPGEAAYGWDCITELGRSKPADSIRNAASFAFFAVAMYLENADWHTGFAEPMPGKGKANIPRPPKQTPSPSPSPSPSPKPKTLKKGS